MATRKSSGGSKKSTGKLKSVPATHHKRRAIGKKKKVSGTSSGGPRKKR